MIIRLILLILLPVWVLLEIALIVLFLDYNKDDESLDKNGHLRGDSGDDNRA